MTAAIIFGWMAGIAAVSIGIGEILYRTGNKDIFKKAGNKGLYITRCNTYADFIRERDAEYKKMLK